MTILRRSYLRFFVALALGVATLGAFQATVTESLAQSSYFTSRGCVNCHAAPATATCNGCHHHGNSSLKATTDKTIYSPGETVTATLSGGSRTGWIRAILYDQNNAQVAVSSGNASGMGGSATFPAPLSASAPATAGTYTWKMAYFGNQDGTGAGDVHSEVTVNTNSFTVSAPPPAVDTVAPTISAFVLPTTATGPTIPVTSLVAADNVAVTGYLVTTSAAAPAAGAAGWTAAPPASVSAAAAGSTTFYAWAKDGAGNVSPSRSATVNVTIATTSIPVLTVSTLADGAYTNNATLNVSGNATDPDGITSVTVNGNAVTVNPDGSFSTAVTLNAGGNSITVVATDTVGTAKSDVRTITYDGAAPLLTVSSPADNSTTTSSFIAVTGSVNETSTVTVSDNSGSPQSAAMSGNNFSTSVNLVAGINTITITATDLAGNTSNAKRTVTYDNSTGSLSLAVTYPEHDITTNRTSLMLKGRVTDASGKVEVRIVMDGHSYTPKVHDGAFQQRIALTNAKVNKIGEKKGHRDAKERLYVITVTATDAAGNSATVTRNVIFNRAGHDNGHDDD